jgi:cell shape-determining protein MreD
MRLKTPRETRILYIKTAVRWTLYYVLIFFSFIIMTSGTWLKPLFLIPIPLCIAINNNQYAAVFTGAICGFLTDIACGKLFGYNAVLISFFCIVVSVLYELYLKDKFLNFIIISAGVSFIQCWLDYKFYYQMWKYDDVERIFRKVSLRVWIYTVIASVFIYLIMKLINHFLMPKNHLTIEEAIVTRNQQ